MAMNGPKQEYSAASRIFNILEKQSVPARKRILDIVSEQLTAAPVAVVADPRQISLMDPVRDTAAPVAAPAADEQL